MHSKGYVAFLHIDKNSQEPLFHCSSVLVTITLHISTISCCNGTVFRASDVLYALSLVRVKPRFFHFYCNIYIHHAHMMTALRVSFVDKVYKDRRGKYLALVVDSNPRPQDQVPVLYLYRSRSTRNNIFESRTNSLNFPHIVCLQLFVPYK